MQLSVLLLASKTEKHLLLFLGTILAFFAVDGLAILAGEWVADLVPSNLLNILSGAVFIFLGFTILFFRNEKAETKSRYYLGHPLYSGFILIFVAEWGDKTQIAAGLFATRYNSLMVLIGVLIVLSLLSIIAIYLGKFISDKVTRETLTKLTGFLFIGMFSSSFN